MRRLGTFAVLGLLLVGAVGMLYALGLQGIRAEEERLRADALALRAAQLDEVVTQVGDDLERLRSLEAERPYDQFRHLYLPTELVGNSLALLVSPLANTRPAGVAAFFELRDGVLSSPAFPGELSEAEAPTQAAAATLPTLRRLEQQVALLPGAEGSLLAPTTVEVDPLLCQSNLSNDLALAQIDEAQRDPRVDAQLRGEWDAYRTRQGANTDQVPPESNFQGQTAYVPQNKRNQPAQVPVVEVEVEAFRVFAGPPGTDGWPELLVVARRIRVPGAGAEQTQTLGPEEVTWWQGLVVDLPWLRARCQGYLAGVDQELGRYAQRGEDTPVWAGLELAPATEADPGKGARVLPAPLDTLQILDSEAPPADAFVLGPSRGVLHGALALALLVLGSGSWILGRILNAEQTLARRRSDFVAALTHELKAPLTGMRAMVELLNDGLVTDPAKQREYYGSLLQESERLSRLVRNVLDASRLERSMPLVTISRPLDPAPTLVGIAESFRTRLEGAGFELQVELADDLPPVRADPDALHQIVGNLIDNAAKYGGGAEQRVELSARPGEGCVEVRVRDWGPGVSAGEQRTIFERFVRGSGPREVGGAGLGLAIARAQSASLGAELVLEPSEIGACFRLTLPLAPAEGDA